MKFRDQDPFRVGVICAVCAILLVGVLSGPAAVANRRRAREMYYSELSCCAEWWQALRARWHGPESLGGSR